MKRAKAVLVGWSVLMALLATVIILTSGKRPGSELPVSMTKYANQTAMPAPTATRGMPPGLRAQMQKLFSSSGKALWVGRGPTADQVLIASSVVPVNDLDITDRFPQGLVNVSFKMEHTMSVAPGAVTTFTAKLLLDGKTALGDHQAASAGASATGNYRIPMVIEDVIPLTAGSHTISVQITVGGGTVGPTIHAGTGVLIVKQL